MLDLTHVTANMQEVFGITLDTGIWEAAQKFDRKRFVSRIYDDRRKTWVTNNERERWQELLAEDRFLPIQADDGKVTSSISQPSLVLAMTQLLQLRPGDRVLEIGAASGWSAAIMSELVGAQGAVVSVEIDPELMQGAHANIKANSLRNVRIVQGDGLSAVEHDPPFDRIVYTVGARDFPASLLDLLSENGRVVLVHKIDATADVLYVGSKVGGRLELDPVVPVLFVELRGAFEGVDEFVEINRLPDHPVARPFWGDVSGYVDLLYRTAGLRFFLRIAASDYHLIEHDGVRGFGLWGGNRAIVLQGTNVVQGNLSGVKRFHRLLMDWLELGMPGLTGFKLRISKLDRGLGSKYRYQGTEVLFEYSPVLPIADKGKVNAGDNVLPLWAASSG